MLLRIIHVLVRKSGSLLIKIGNWLISFSLKIYAPQKSLFEKNKAEWYRIKGDENLRVQYDLSPDSIVFDVGGFLGLWCVEISARYSPIIFVFEPVKEFYDILQNRFSANKNIKVFPYGLAAKNSNETIAVMSESSSSYREKTKLHENSEKQIVEFKDIVAFLNENNISHIDLIKINIEGGEYELLERLINIGFINNIENIQVQFHDFVENAESRMTALKKKLNETHELTYEYTYVWENWKRRK